MMFANDVVLCAEERREAQKDLSSWCNALEKRGTKVSRSKTEYMCCKRDSEGELEIGEEAIPTVTEFKYLGSTVESAGGVDSEVNRRIQAGWNNWRRMSGILCNKKVPNRVKGKILKTVHSTTSDVVQHWYGTLEQEAGKQAGSGGYEDEQVDARSVKE